MNKSTTIKLDLTKKSSAEIAEFIEAMLAVKQFFKKSGLTVKIVKRKV